MKGPDTINMVETRARIAAAELERLEAEAHERWLEEGRLMGWLPAE